MRSKALRGHDLSVQARPGLFNALWPSKPVVLQRLRLAQQQPSQRWALN